MRDAFVKPGIYTLAVIIVLGALAMLFSRPQSSPNNITPGEVSKIMADTSYLLLDVRTPQEHETAHLEGSMLIPIQELESRIAELERYRNKTIVAYCRSGNRSGTAERILTESGFKAVNMVGGMIRWNAEKLPGVVR